MLRLIFISLLILLTSCNHKDVNKEEVILVQIDKKMLPVRIIPEKNLDCVYIDVNGKAYSEYQWFMKVE